MRDRSSLAATAIALEAIGAVLLRRLVKGMDDAERRALAEEIASEAMKIGDEVVAAAPSSAPGAHMSADQAKQAAQRIQLASSDAIKAVIEEAIAG